MRIFVSSVRRGLEEERDALPGLITAIGHTPVRFEDFTAQPAPSREACLEGVASSDAYLLILGPNYGHRFDDTGQSPTHDEWVAATTAGLPRVVYRKINVEFEPDQDTFAQSIGNYTTGVFYDSFATTAELLTKVAAKVRELAQATGPLTFEPMTAPVHITWRADFAESATFGGTASQPTLEIHVIPIDPTPRSSRVMSALADSMPNTLRNSGMVAASEGLDIARPAGAIAISVPPRQTRWDAHRESQLLGVRLDVEGQVSVWATLPGDAMGAVLDQSHLPNQIATLLRLVGSMRLIDSSNIAIALGVDPAMMLSTGRADQLPRQSATILSMSDQPIRVPPDELVTAAALDTGALDLARILSRALLDAAQSHR